MFQWDDWVPQDRVRKWSDENRALAAQLHDQMKTAQQKAVQNVKKNPVAGVKGGKGSDFSTPRGSEERHGAGRGPRRTRDYELESVSPLDFSFCLFHFLLGIFSSYSPGVIAEFGLFWFTMSSRALPFFLDLNFPTSTPLSRQPQTTPPPRTHAILQSWSGSLAMMKALRVA